MKERKKKKSRRRTFWRHETMLYSIFTLFLLHCDVIIIIIDLFIAVNDCYS